MVIENDIIIQMAHPLPPVTDISKQQHQHFGHLWHVLTQQQGQLNNVALIVPELLQRMASMEQQLNMVAAHLDLLVSLSTSVHLNGLAHLHQTMFKLLQKMAISFLRMITLLLTQILMHQ